MKRLYMLAITSLLVAACAEDIDNNNLGKPLISFGVNEPYAAVADSNEPAATRSFNATDAFTPGNSLFSNAVYASDADKQSAANRVQVESLEGDYPQELCMLVSKEPWPQPSTATRATENTTAVLNASGKQIGIYSSIYSGNADYSTSSSKFEPTTATAWPTTGSSSTAYDIYAWHPTTFTSTGISMSGQTFTYTLPTTSAAMVDLIGTKESHSYSENNDGSISLTFNHLLAPVCFKLAAGLSGTITSIKFSNIVTTGTYTLGATHADDATYGYTWTATTTGAYTASVSGTGGASEVQVDGSHYFMMIPQTVAAGVVVTITITDGASQSNTLTYTVPSGGQVWKAGQVTTYTISTSTITSFTLTYPQWTESGGSGTTYGPVDNYDVTTEDYGYVGLFAVDKANKIVISNAKVKITSAASHVGTCDLTDAANTAVLGNYILSQNYAYYVYYPYKSSLTGIPTNDQTTYSTQAQSAAAQATPADAADTFFANVTAGWAVETDQSATDKSKYKASDLQIAKLSTNFTMQHKMGLLNGTIPATSLVDDVIVYNGNTYNSGATGEKWTRIDAECTTISWNASTTFTSSTNKPFNDTTNGILYYVAKPSDATIAISATAGSHLYAWSASGSNTTVNTANTYKSFTIVTPDYSNDFNQKIWKFNYTGAAKQWVVPHTGTYTVECWGASGGASYSNHHDGHAGYGGNGGYVSGKIILESDLTFIAKIGGVGITIANATNSGGGWNGGGGGTNSWDSNQRSAGGGGATDLSITGDVKNRIIVAAGGGGACQHNGAHAGGLIGYTEMTPGQDGYGGKQDAVSSTPSNSGYGTSTSSFGAGGEGKSIGGGGGGGWYGGSGGTRNKGVDGSGGGGSSFISGHPGCNAVNTSTGAHLGASTKITYGGRVYEFSDTQMIDGTGKEWTTADQTTGGNNIGRPTNPGGSNGYMIISFEPN